MRARPSRGTATSTECAQGWFRFLNASGELIGTAHVRDDILHGQVVTLYRGLCVAELNYIDGLPHGPYRRRVHEDIYDVPNAAWEEGSFSCGLVSGIFRLRDESGNVLSSRDFGLAPREKSAGAQPGPACYGRGGPASVTDANLVLGRIQPRYFPVCFGPEADQPLDAAAAHARLSELAQA